MPCGGCNQRWLRQTKLTSNGRSVRSASQARRLEQANDAALVAVTYNGSSGNHYIVSPSRSVKNYGYGGRGSRINVYPEDVRLEPATFIPVSVEEARKVWSAFPEGVPQSVLDRLQVPA